MKKIFLGLIWFYQHAISPYKGRGYCNYYPTCSQYAKEAVEMYGFTKGGFMAFKRIVRCNPFVKGGYDAVPIKKELQSNSHKFAKANLLIKRNFLLK